MSKKEIKENIVNETGNVTVSEDVITTVVRNTALEIEGVNSIAGEVTNTMIEIISKKVKKKSSHIKVSIKNKTELTIEIGVVLNFGTNVIDVSKQIQEKIKDTVENMIGMHVLDVDVMVEGIAVSEN